MKTINVYDNDYEYILWYLREFFEIAEDEVTDVDVSEAVASICYEHNLHTN